VWLGLGAEVHRSHHRLGCVFFATEENELLRWWSAFDKGW
jgi:hypothetical protein